MITVMDDYIAKTLRAYDDVQTYEQSTKLLIPKQELDQFLALLEPSAFVLDAGCAYGRDTEYISNKGLKVSAIDLSPALTARAKELYPQLTFAVKDVRDTGFDDETFDGIWCNATLLHLTDEDIDTALREFNRILKVGGILAVSFKKGAAAQTYVENFSSKSERFFNFKTREAFREHLERVGFTEIESHYLNERERYGQNKRDLDWLYSFSRKI